MNKAKHLSYEETITRVSKFCKPGKKYLCNNRSGGLFIMPIEKIQKSWNDLFKDFLVEYRKDMSEVKDRLTIVEHKVDTIETKVDVVALDLKETKIRNNLK